MSTSWDAVTPNDLDLSAFTGFPSSATVYRTTADEAVSLQAGIIPISPKAHIVDRLPIRSISTYVIDGVSPLPLSASTMIEGLHHIASVATNLCLNIIRSSTKSGEAIIPYPCDGGFSNMEFNFVDMGHGFYLIDPERHDKPVPEHLEFYRFAGRRQDLWRAGKFDSVELQRWHSVRQRTV